MWVFVAVSDEEDRVPVVMPGKGASASAEILVEIDEEPAAMLAGGQPAGVVFAVGWVMAELFDPRRRVSVAERQPPFDPQTQLPLVTDLAADPRRVFLAAELAEYLRWFPHLAEPLSRVTAQANNKAARAAAEDPATAGAAGAAQADDAVHAPVADLHQAVLDEFADDPERLSAYQLGLSLSDLVWLPFIAAPGEESPASRPSCLFGLFTRPHLAAVHTLLSGAGTQLPHGSATIVSRSLDNWADWIDVNSARIKSTGADVWSQNADAVLRALRVQGQVWRAVLIADPEVAVQPSMGAWVQAGSSTARAARMITWVILRRFWPLVAVALVALGGLLYLVISNLSGASQVWASLAAVAAIAGSGTWSLGSGVSQALSGVGDEIWSAAKLDAAAWGVTWLPALTATTVERAKLEGRGVAMPQIRKSLDA
jgi:hypothetical protein